MKIGIFGLGTVGGGVIKILTTQTTTIEIAKVCVRDPKKSRDFELPENCEVVTNFDDILNDPEIDTVVELIGGTTAAWDIVKTAIEKNKNVVTANKALIAEHMTELQTLLKNHPTVDFGFEAAVGGGIPIIHTLQRDAALDEITQLSGIINGTTNFILSKMEKEGAAYDDVLAEAQALGYAEADPTADVGGFDARAKISILAKLAFGVNIPEETIQTKGIENITDIDFSYAHSLNSTIKLLAVAEKQNNEISIFVSPVLVPQENTLAKINGATNAVSFKSDNLQETTLIGQGAGRFPTGNAVASDILAISENKCSAAFAKSSEANVQDDLEKNFYIRFQIKDGLGIVQKIGESCAKHNISINSISQLPIGNPDNLPFILTTEKAKASEVKKMCDEISQANFCIAAPFFMPILK